ncbi:MAG: glycosyltransferase [bacterium]|nr:glycosyltransferase [bacterium]
MTGKQISDGIRKTFRYAKRNGWRNAFFAASERMKQIKKPYEYEAPSAETLAAQRTRIWISPPKISVLVPAYETNEAFLGALIESVRAQTYSNWELIIADAGEGNGVRNTVYPYMREDARINYHRLGENKGISGNTNAGLAFVNGAYTALLDHDDLLTPDALYEMVCAALKEPDAALFYSDEDKCDEKAEHFHTPHEKTDFDLDLFLTNNYICHLAMLKTDVLKKLRLRQEYDGAQDYDLFLRVAAEEKKIVHVSKVLYHWRSHEQSTADNPESKRYAYEAGRRALDDFYHRRGWAAHAEEDMHVGFYRTVYEKAVFDVRPDVGVTGGRIVCRKKVTGGAMKEDGTLLYGGMPVCYSGYMNRAVLTQSVPALDLRCISVRDELTALYEEYAGRLTQEESGVTALSLAFCGEVRARGYLLIYNPTDLCYTEK